MFLNEFTSASASLARISENARDVLADIEAVEQERIGEYRAKLERHDWLHEFSDDGNAYRAGRKSLAELREMQSEIDPDCAIWNSVAPASQRRSV